MLRYIIGISILTIGIIIIRALSNGKILRKHQYAFWIVIPLYMILMPFVKIDVPVAETIGRLFSSGTEIASNVEEYDAAPAVIVEAEHVDQADNGNQAVVREEHADPKVISEYGQIPVQNGFISDKKPTENIKIDSILKQISLTVSAVLIVFLIIHNAIFISYCRRNRKYIGRDPESGLKIYSIRHKEAPFLLFNKIYIGNDSGKINDFTICHEACHFKHGDHIWVLIRYLVLFINWYNPIIWTAFVLSGRDCELACDEEVMKKYGADSSKDYARTLLGLLQQQSGMAIGFSISTGMRSGYEMMRKRILNIKNPADHSRKALALSLAAILLFTSCSFVNTSKNARKVSADSPWFNSSTYDVNLGTDPDRELEDNDYDLRLAGVDENYLVVYALGDYEGTMDQKNSNFDDYVFGIVSIIDKTTKSVVNTIDVQGSLDKISDETVINVRYANKRVTVKTSIKETDYDPLTLEELDSRPVSKMNMFPLPEERYYVGDYVIEARWDSDGYNGCFVLKIIAPDGEIKSAELKENGTNINSIKMLPLSDTKALFITHSSRGYIYFELDLTDGKVSIADVKDYEWIDLNQISEPVFGTDGKLYCRNDNAILRVDTSSKSVEEVFNYNWSSSNRTKLQRFFLADCSGDTIIFIGHSSSWGAFTGAQGSFQIIELTKADKNPNSGKTILELYSPSLSEEIADAVEKYNENNKKFFIEFSERYNEQDYYSINGDWRNYSAAELNINTLNAASAFSNALSKDIIAGNGPDILIGMSRYSQLNNSEYLVDLSPYVNKLDSDQYFTNIIEGSKTNGTLYQLPLSIYIHGIVTDTKYAGNSGVGFTYDEYRDFVKDTLNGKDVITAGQALYFTELFSFEDDKFITDGKADFSAPEFKDMAEYVKENVPENGSSVDTIYNNGIYKYANYHEIQSYHDFYGTMNQMRGLENLSVLGIPSSDGRGPMFKTNCSVAISAQAVNIDACGEFVKLLLSEEIQTGIAMSGMGFAVNRNAFRMAGDGAIQFCNNLDDEFEANKLKLSEKDIDNLERIILSCSSLSNEDPDISIILIEEMPPYFLGQKDLDSVIKIVQDRAQKVLDERG